MRYEPATKERALPWATRAGIALQRLVSSLRVGDCGEASSRQTAELDIWEDEGGTPLGRVPEHPGRQVGCWHVEQHCEEFSG